MARPFCLVAFTVVALALLVAVVDAATNGGKNRVLHRALGAAEASENLDPKRLIGAAALGMVAGPPGTQAWVVGPDGAVERNLDRRSRTQVQAVRTDTEPEYPPPVWQYSSELGGVMNAEEFLKRRLAEKTLSEATVFDIYEQLLRELANFAHHPDGRIHLGLDLAHVVIEESGGKLLVHLLGDGNSVRAEDVGPIDEEEVKVLGASVAMIPLNMLLLEKLLGVPHDDVMDMAFLHTPHTDEQVEHDVSVVVGSMKKSGLVDGNHDSLYRKVIDKVLRCFGSKPPSAEDVLEVLHTRRNADLK